MYLYMWCVLVARSQHNDKAATDSFSRNYCLRSGASDHVTAVTVVTLSESLPQPPVIQILSSRVQGQWRKGIKGLVHPFDDVSCYTYVGSNMKYGRIPQPH